MNPSDELSSIDPGAIVSYHRMTTEEREARLQRGMNYRLHPRYSVILMSQTDTAPYADSAQDEGATLIYEGHNAWQTRGGPHPRTIDQPLETATGRRTQNARFRDAAIAYRDGDAEAEPVKVYEKIRRGIWFYHGIFRLTDCWSEESDGRSVFKFRLEIEDESASPAAPSLREHSRMIPSAVKQAVWRRDRGRCVVCGAEDELHFDHIIPYSRGGSSIVAENVQLLCARHNLEKSDRIQ